MKLTLKELNKAFDEARDNGSKYIGLSVDIGSGFLLDEIIINGRENFDEKQAYYNVAYDEALEHKHAEGIRITGYVHGDSFDHVENRLVRTVFATALN